jgi:hypothetical protein
MERLKARAIELCGVATLGIAVVVVMTFLGWADMPALRAMCLIAAVSAFIVANVKMPNIAAGAALGGVCFALWWVGAHIVTTITSGAFSPGWFLDVMLGMALLVGLANLVAMTQRLAGSRLGANAA